MEVGSEVDLVALQEVASLPEEEVSVVHQEEEEEEALVLLLVLVVEEVVLEEGDSNHHQEDRIEVMEIVLLNEAGFELRAKVHSRKKGKRVKDPFGFESFYISISVH